MIENNKPGHISHDYAVAISADEYIWRFRDADADRFLEYCRQCHNYNQSWAYPPFDHDIERDLCQYRNLLLIATKIEPENRKVSFSESGRLIYPEKVRIERKLLFVDFK